LMGSLLDAKGGWSWMRFDKQVITRVLEQSLGKLFFERQLSPFKIRNMIWFRHGMVRFRL